MEFLFDIIFFELNINSEEKKLNFIIYNLDIIYYFKLFWLLFNFYFINFINY